MIATVGFHDVINAEGFIGRTLTKSRIRFTPGEREELMCEGLTILAELAARFEPHRDGYATVGRFSGYAAQMLPLRLQDAYDRLHPEHHVTRDPEGRRVYTYGLTAMSIHTEDMHELQATAQLGNPSQVHYEFGPTIEAALHSLPVWDRLGAQRVIRLIDEGYSTDEIARRLQLGRATVSRLQAAMASAITHAQHQEAA